MNNKLGVEDVFPPMGHAKGVVLTGWIVVDDYCAMRAVAGQDAQDITNRVAFIEKTPRVRVAPMVGADASIDGANNWVYGYKGSGGSGDPQALGLYGFDADSRSWCDSKLTEMGYILN